ncbi:DNA-binding transcriptional MerR regulator [Crossiella equi]|uniref:DNA-binding transcriptional MerR regulator n=1 Tax=Crossiella equi TaxID=130796 RepID=A0ABS5ANP4_9PSEU|nr:MerR family transcriptional regulator [Crossiella equi]MBP2478188.1 DNA-binding transcriptional MerR regulator [Crossiella equi]
MSTARGITISQAATFAGITVKTIRHYHRLGLLEEPRRDASGYRRYGSTHLLRLVRVRTLAAAGVPLAEIADLLDADPEVFADALADVERDLTERINELIARRDTLQRLATGDRVLLPEHACAVLDRVTGLGFSEAERDMTREAMVLVKALAPEDFDGYVAQLAAAMDDPEYLVLVRRMLAAGALAADDPRVEELATALVGHFLANPHLVPVLTGAQTRADSDLRHHVLTQHRTDQNPGWTRLHELVVARLREAGHPVL